MGVCSGSENRFRARSNCALPGCVGPTSPFLKLLNCHAAVPLQANPVFLAARGEMDGAPGIKPLCKSKLRTHRVFLVIDKKCVGVDPGLKTRVSLQRSEKYFCSRQLSLSSGTIPQFHKPVLHAFRFLTRPERSCPSKNIGLQTWWSPSGSFPRPTQRHRAMGIGIDETGHNELAQVEPLVTLGRPQLGEGTNPCYQIIFEAEISG